jgi:transposase
MNKEDGRKLEKAALEERRKTIIRRKISGVSVQEIADAVGCCRAVIYNLWYSWIQCRPKEREGKVIKVKAAGTKPGERRRITPEQERKIQKLIQDKYPDQLKLDFALWTREAVMQLIQQRLGVAISIRAVGDYLKRWGFTPQKPAKRAYERDPVQVGIWLEQTYPAIKERAKIETADIFWGDEASVRANDVRGRGYAPKGQTPTVEQTGKRTGISMISAITNWGKILWKLYEGSITSVRVLEFIQRLVWKRKKKVYLILDNASTHKSKILKEGLKDNKHKIEIFYLPSYSPDLNPDERVNADVKYGVGSKHPRRTKEELRTTTEAHLTMLKEKP